MLTGWGTTSSEQEADLPPGWTASTDPQTGKPYYYNAATQESSWRPPLIKPGTAKPARAAAAAAKAPRDAPRDSASARRMQRETKPPSKPPAASNTGSSRDGKRVVLTPRTGAATTIQAQSRGHLTRQSSPARDRSSSAVPGHGARSLSLEPTGARDEDALARGMHAASDFISCLQANLRLPAQPLAKFKFEFDGDKALARLAGQAKAEALGGAGEPLSGEQLQAGRTLPPTKTQAQTQTQTQTRTRTRTQTRTQTQTQTQTLTRRRGSRRRRRRCPRGSARSTASCGAPSAWPTSTDLGRSRARSSRTPSGSRA